MYIIFSLQGLLRTKQPVNFSSFHIKKFLISQAAEFPLLGYMATIFVNLMAHSTILGPSCKMKIKS